MNLGEIQELARSQHDPALRRLRIMPVAELTVQDRDHMFALMGRFFNPLQRAAFETDLAEKDWALLLCQDCQLLGFSTLSVWQEESLLAFFSGDTIVAPQARAGFDLPRLWSRTVFRLAAQQAPIPAVWFLISSGFRTYRFLPVFFREFYPRPDRPTPAGWQSVLDRLAQRRFPSGYDPSTGVVRLPNPSQLRDSEVPAGRQRDAHVAFFLERNPGHRQGDELACLTPIHPDNLTPAGRRMLGEA